MSTHCLLADDHPALVAAVGEFLEDNGYTVVGPAANAQEAIDLAASRRPELAVVDYRMPGPGGRELLARLKEVAPDTRVLVYTADAGEALVQEALGRGAAAIVLKEAPLQDLLRALEAVYDGGTYVDPALAAAALGAHRSSRPGLTSRERDVLTHLSRGETHEEIGRQLGISIETVRTHLRKASEKLEASTRTQAVATAYRLGLIE